jgi:hypothetical protein
VRRRLMVGTFVVAGALAVAAPAWGGTFSVDFITGSGSACANSSNVTYRAAPGEVNQLKFVLGVAEEPPTNLGCYSDTFQMAAAASDTAGVTPGQQCRSARPTAAVCASTDAVSAVIDLGDRNDTLRLAVSYGADIDAGTGDDNLNTANGASDTVDCGDGVDTISADASDQLVNCENVTLTPA